VVHGIESTGVVAEPSIVGLAVIPVPDHRLAKKKGFLTLDVGALEHRFWIKREDFRLQTDKR